VTGDGAGDQLDEAAALIALAEIEEALGRVGAAAVSIGSAIALLGGDALPVPLDGEHGANPAAVLLWCQAHERQAGLERQAADFGSASARLTRVLDVAGAAFGQASPAVVSAASSLGAVFRHAGNLDAAGTAYRLALAAAQGLTLRDPLAEAGLLRDLGGLAHSRGDAVTGIPLAERGLALRIGALGEAHPDVATDLNALGALYYLAGRYRDAEESCRRALGAFESCYGPEHLEVAATCANLAALRADHGDFAAAESFGRRSLRILQIVRGPEDAEAGLAMLNLAAAIAGQNRMREAAAYADCALAILSDRLPTGHPYLQAARDSVEYLKEKKVTRHAATLRLSRSELLPARPRG
jgi:tetratricopeptide (TPR) repeat protein